MRIQLIIGWCVLWAGLGRAETNVVSGATPPAAVASGAVAEIVSALKAHYVDRDQLDDQKLTAASVAGILNALGQGAVLLTPPVNETNTTAAVDRLGSPVRDPVLRAEIIEPDIGYVHLVVVAAPAVNAVDAELGRLADAKASGYVLDLRYANGDDYAAAAMIATRFLADGQELFRIKRATGADEVFRAGAGGTEAPVREPDAPLILLVNSQTRGSAEALVGALRAQDRGIVIGSLTAGSAVAWQDVPLQDGRVLRVASAKVVLQPADPHGMSTPDVFPGGIAPDIYVAIDAAVERDVLFNVSTNVTLTVSLQPSTTKPRRSEAELVKAFRGEPLELGFPKVGEPPAEGQDNEEQVQAVRDVVLQRAVDILKGIRVLLSQR